jgi:UDP-N-acetylmuramoyl-tripeptide--D-alanyl-D-alanine ligase
VEIAGLGRLAVHNALAGAAVGLAAGMALDEIVPGLAVGGSAPHRSAVHRAGGVTIVDDAYNASPGSVRAALELLAGLPGRHLAVLGEMRELGDAFDDGHREVGEAAAHVVDRLVVVATGDGRSAQLMVEGARAAGMTSDRLAVVDAGAAAGVLAGWQGWLRAGDVVLVKASRGVELEHVVDDLLDRLGGESGG